MRDTCDTRLCGDCPGWEKVGVFYPEGAVGPCPVTGIMHPRTFRCRLPMEQRPEMKAKTFTEKTEAKMGTVVVLRQKGMSIENIAKELHMNEGTVRKILRRETHGQA